MKTLSIHESNDSDHVVEDPVAIFDPFIDWNGLLSTTPKENLLDEGFLSPPNA